MMIRVRVVGFLLVRRISMDHRKVLGLLRDLRDVIPNQTPRTKRRSVHLMATLQRLESRPQWQARWNQILKGKLFSASDYLLIMLARTIEGNISSLFCTTEILCNAHWTLRYQLLNNNPLRLLTP